MMDVDLVLVSRATLLLAAANGAPILARQLLADDSQRRSITASRLAAARPS
jgi:hypothetical protein